MTKDINNNTTKNSFDLALGNHKYTVERDGKIYAERNFSISTNLADQRKPVDELYQLGHIKSYSVVLSIKTQLLLAEIAEQFKLFKLRNLLIQSTINFIMQQNRQTKPLIDNYASEIFVADLIYIKGH